MKIGFSTGALAYADFRRAYDMLLSERVSVVEFSALRIAEWAPLLEGVLQLDISSFEYISLHLPSSMTGDEERMVADSLRNFPHLDWPLILHPDTVSDFMLWHQFGSRTVLRIWISASRLAARTSN